MADADEALLVTITCPPASAETLAVALVESHLAACVNVIPGVRSVYRWKGAVMHDEEAMLVAKTAASRFDALKQAVLAQHPNELPEIVAVKLTRAHDPYLAWLLENSQ